MYDLTHQFAYRFSSMRLSMDCSDRRLPPREIFTMFDECIYFNATAIARIVEREWSTAYSAFNLSPLQALAIRVIVMAPGITPTRLTQTLVISRSTASRLIDGLHRRHFVDRQYTKVNARECLILPTSAAVKLRYALEQAELAASESVTEKIGVALAHTALGYMLGMREALLGRSSSAKASESAVE